jgi:hypothetical protein
MGVSRSSHVHKRRDVPAGAAVDSVESDHRPQV